METILLFFIWNALYFHKFFCFRDEQKLVLGPETVHYAQASYLSPNVYLTMGLHFSTSSNMSRKIAGSIPGEVIGLFSMHIMLPAALWPWGRMNL
jgi:hypothetical protein